MTEEKKFLYFGMIYMDAEEPDFEVIAPTEDLAKDHLANYAITVLDNDGLTDDAIEAGWDTMTSEAKLQWMEQNAQYHEWDVRQVEVVIAAPAVNLLGPATPAPEAEAPVVTAGLSSEVVAAQVAFQTMAKLKGK